MIYEFALQPDVVASWTEPDKFRYFKDKFGVGTPRIVSRYPRAWKKSVYDSFGGSEIERARLEELLKILGSKTVPRSSEYNPDNTWLENTIIEHQRLPFHAVISDAAHEENNYILDYNSLGHRENKLWDIQTSLICNRDITALADLIGGLLKISRTVIFVEPYFRPIPRMINPICQYLQQIFDPDCQSPGRVEIIFAFSHDNENSKHYENYKINCTNLLQEQMISDSCLKIVPFTEKQDGPKLHNRYILTEFGGLIFGTGLDEGGQGEDDDIALLTLPQYEKRWNQYASTEPAFDLAEEPFEIIGK